MGLIKQFTERHTWVRFAVIGVIATAIHYGIYYLLHLAGVLGEVAYGTGYAVSLCFNFWATGRYTFRTRLDVRKGVLFLMCHGVNFLLHMSLFSFFTRVAGLDPRLAPIPVFAIAVPVNYFLVRSAMKERKR